MYASSAFQWEVVLANARDLVSRFRYMSLPKFNTYILLLITLIEILFSHPIDILKIFILLSMGVFVMYVNGLC